MRLCLAPHVLEKNAAQLGTHTVCPAITLAHGGPKEIHDWLAKLLMFGDVLDHIATGTFSIEYELNVDVARPVLTQNTVVAAHVAVIALRHEVGLHFAVGKLHTLQSGLFARGEGVSKPDLEYCGSSTPSLHFLLQVAFCSTFLVLHTLQQGNELGSGKGVI